MSDYPRNKWLRIRALKPSEPRFIHVSAPIIPNPARALEMAAQGYSLLPEFVVGPRSTYNIGRNKAKREKRAQRKSA